MKPRKKIQSEHEDFVIHHFLMWYNNIYRTQFNVIAKLDPPDAIAKSGNKIIWIEHADVYRSSEEAKEERSFVTPGEVAYSRKETPILEPDKRTASAFLSILQKKINKQSYRDSYNLYGPGILILTERDPLFSRSTLNRIIEQTRSASLQINETYFDKVVLAYRDIRSIVFIPIRLLRDDFQDSLETNLEIM